MDPSMNELSVHLGLTPSMLKTNSTTFELIAPTRKKDDTSQVLESCWKKATCTTNVTVYCFS